MTIRVSENGVGMRYNSEVELRDSLGLSSWQQLSKSTVFNLVDRLQDTDPEVAIQVISQVPEISMLVREVMDDAGKAHDVTVAANTRGLEMVHEVHMERLAILRAELDKELSSDERLRVLDDITQINAQALQKDTENKTFLSEQSDKRLAMAGGLALTVVAMVVGVAGHKRGLRPGRLFKS